MKNDIRGNGGMRMLKLMVGQLLVVALALVNAVGADGTIFQIPSTKKINLPRIDNTYYGGNNKMTLYIGERTSDVWYYNHNGNMAETSFYEHYALWYDNSIHYSGGGNSGNAFDIIDYFGGAFNDADRSCVTKIDDIEVMRKVKIPPGDATYFRITYQVKNTGSRTLTDVRFYEIVDYDVPYTGDHWNDEGWYDSRTDFVWIKDSAWFQNGFTADKPSSQHGLTDYYTELFYDANDGNLNNAESYYGDPAVGLQWGVGDLAPGGVWDIEVTFWFGNPNSLFAKIGSDQTVYMYNPVKFDASASFADEGEIVEYNWDMDGDGGYDDASGVAPTYVFTSQGTYEVVLQVVDSLGNRAYDNCVITVMPAAFKNVAMRTWIPDSGLLVDSSRVAPMATSIADNPPDRLLEWRIGSMAVGDIHKISYEIEVLAPVPGEKRMVEREVELSSQGINDAEAQSVFLGPSYVDVTSGYEIIASTDKSAYLPPENALVSVSLGLPASDSANTNDLLAKIHIEDSLGNVVKTFPSILPDLEASEQRYNVTFNTSGCLPGVYLAVGDLLADGENVATDSALFEISAESPAAILGGAVSTDKARYIGNETATITSKTLNQSKNLPLSGIAVLVEVLGTDGATLKSYNYSIANLLASSVDQKALAFPIGTLPVGSYTAKQTVSLGGEQLFTRQATFEVVASVTAGSGVSGTLAASPATIKRRVGGTDLSVTAKNSGNVDLSGVKLKVDVTDPASGLAIKSFEHVADLPMGASVNCAFDLDSVGFDTKSYPVSLHADFSYGTDSYHIPLDVAGVTVTNDTPAANAGADQSKEGTSLAGDSFTLDGSGSSDGNSTNPPGYDDDIASYTWSEGGDILGQGKTLDHLFAWGVHPVTLTVTDTLGASSSDGAVVTVADTTAPTIANLSPGNGSIGANATPELAALVADACSGVDSPTIELKLNGAILAYSFDAATGRIAATPSANLPDGWNQAVLTLKDRAGNQGSSPEWRFGVDTTAPVIAGLSPVGDSIVADSSPELAANISDSFSGVDSSSVELAVDGSVVAASYLDGQLSATPTSLSDGWHDLAVSAKDMVGNVGHSAAWRLGVDTTAPTASNLSPTPGSTIANSQPLFEAVVADAFSGVDPASVSISLDGTTLVCNFDASSGKVVAATPSTLADGSHQVSLTAKDALGNAAAPTQWQFVVDATAPVISSMSPVNGAIANNMRPAISAVVADAGCGVDSGSIALTLDGAVLNASFDPATGSVSASVDSPLADGWHTIVLTAKDLAGNLGSSPEWKFGVDTTAPAIAAMSPANGSIIGDAQAGISATVTDSFSGVDPNTIALAVDGATVTATFDSATGKVSATQASALADGWHTVVLTASDRAGNPATSSEWRFAMDTTAPVITNLFPVNGAITGDSTPALSANVSDALSGVDPSSIALTVDGTALAATFSAGTVSATPANALADGWHYLVLTVKDMAGNQATSTEWKVGVDTTPPTITALTPAPGATVNESQPTLSAVLADSFSGVDSSSIELKLNGVDVPFSYDVATGQVTGTPSAAVQDGDYEITLAVKDMAGNQANAASWQVKIRTWLIFHNSSSGELQVSGSSKQVNGRVHSNAKIKISGSNNCVSGLVSAVGTIKVTGSNNNLGSTQPGAPAQPIPVYVLDYYRQNATYTHNGNWQVSGSNVTLPAGVHFVNGAVHLSGSRISGDVTIVATGRIQVSGSNATLRDADGINRMLLFSGSGDIDISGSSGNYRGLLYAPGGGCKLTGSGDTFAGAVIGDTVQLTGSNKTFGNIQ